MDTSQIAEWCIERSTNCVCHAELLEGLLSVAQDVGISDVGYIFKPQSGHAQILSSYSREWQEYYRVNKLEAVDPVVHMAYSSTYPTSWSGTSGQDQNRDFFELAAEYGVAQRGIVVPVKNAGTTAVCSFATDVSQKDWEDLCKEYMPTFQMLAEAFHGSASNLRDDIKPLTRRERHVLEWAGCGKNAWETGRILGLTEGTVLQYLHSASVKMNTSSKLHCVISALEAGLLNLDAPGEG